jgi:hypothetical protein
MFNERIKGEILFLIYCMTEEGVEPKEWVEIGLLKEKRIFISHGECVCVCASNK